MKRMMLASGLLVLLAGCGAREDLKPAAGAALPVAPYGTAQKPAMAELLAAPIQTRPARSDDMIESTDKRRSDKFDLPPR